MSTARETTVCFPGFRLPRSLEKNVQQYFERPRKELLAEAVRAIRDSDIPQESYEMARGFCAAALQALAVLPEDPARQALQDLTGYALERRS